MLVLRKAFAISFDEKMGKVSNIKSSIAYYFHVIVFRVPRGHQQWWLKSYREIYLVPSMLESQALQALL